VTDTSRFRGLHDIRPIARQVRFEQLAFWLNRLGAIFTIGFSVVFLVLIGAAVGHQRVPYLGNIEYIQYYVPVFVAYGVMAACFTMLAINLVVRRETGLLKRLRLSPLPIWILLSAIFVSTMIVALIQVVVLLLIGRFGYGVAFPQSVDAFVVALAVGILSFTAMGIAISTVIPNQDTAGPLTAAVFFALLFLSGLWFPIKATSALAKISSVFPVHHFMEAVFNAYTAQRGVSPWAWHDLLIVAIWGAVATVVAVLCFRWAPRRA
jgi:ABC-2 type transport system permease protein